MANYYSGLILQREGRFTEALQYLTWTAQLAKNGEWKDRALAKVEELRLILQQEEKNAKPR